MTQTPEPGKLHLDYAAAKALDMKIGLHPVEPVLAAAKAKGYRPVISGFQPGQELHIQLIKV